MTTQQSIDDILSALAHVLRQLERDARNWEHQAHDWKAVADRQRAEIEAAYAAQRQAEARVAELKNERRALCDLLSADSSTVAGQTLVEAARAIIQERDELRAALAAREASDKPIAE